MIADKSLLLLRKSYLTLFNRQASNSQKLPPVDFSKQDASDVIKNKLNDANACMIARLGSTELEIMSAYRAANLNSSRYIKFILGKIDNYRFDQYDLEKAHIFSGIFPPTEDFLSKFSEFMIKELENVDVLGSWLKNEQVFNEQLKNAIKITLRDIEPYYHQDPWTSALKGKNVLVIHPFTNSIINQYKNRELLFENKNILPEFNLKTIRSVQSLKGQITPFKDWFEALDSMKEKIDKIDFDIALLGCGAYGLPLAAHIKRIGKKAVHIGGATQILFGIKGKRWENHELISKLMNEHWRKPDESEKPTNYKDVEDGCYW